ncbi:HNH endonuclease signature motif containing protein [Aureimonas ureilytica]|uniref:HNH endonuclease signature motif containing protein n=1 Tax=Aureimonas ureilytica TaxID=401562 RepID=UPI000A95A831|nr:HNH endonuclease signature motif containing protein [Aureimonas ureilytica]
MKGHPTRYSAVEKAWLYEYRLLPISQLHTAFCAAFGRDDVTAANLKALRQRNGWKTGRTGRFVKGSEPLNKGARCPEGFGGRHPNSRRTQFCKGNSKGHNNNNYQPIGTECIKEGYLRRKMHDSLPRHTRWELVHRIEWQLANGSIPTGYALKCLDGDKLNTAPSNWELVPRGVLARLNGGRLKKRIGFDAAPKELKPALMTIAKIEHRAHEIQKSSPMSAAEPTAAKIAKALTTGSGGNG